MDLEREKERIKRDNLKVQAEQGRINNELLKQNKIDAKQAQIQKDF